MSNELLITQLVESNRELTAKCTEVLTKYEALAETVEQLKANLKEIDGDVDGIKAKFTWAKGYVAGWAAAIALGSSAVTLLFQWAARKLAH